MAAPVSHVIEGMFRPKIETDQLIAASGLAERVTNLQPTPEGSMRTISGPGLFVNEDIEVHGVGQTVVNGHEILVRQISDRLQVFKGFDTTKWQDITSPDGTGDTFRIELSVNDAPNYPPVFIPVPGGLIMIPKGRNPRSLFFDGERVTPLGFTERPSAPEIRVSQEKTVAQLSAATGHVDAGNRVGVVVGISGSTTNNSRRERYACEGAVQWVSTRGDLSPVSARSGKLEVQAAVINAANDPESGLFRVLWRGIDDGPPHTAGRILGRTRSLITSGTAQLFEVPQHQKPSSFLLATIPDNVAQVHSDNASEGSLITPLIDVAPMPIGRVATIAMGRLWVADDSGAVWFSLPGRWGTFGADNYRYPDTAASEITGMLAVPGGLIVCTRTSTHFITPNDAGDDFRSATLSSKYGCTAPGSMQMLPTGQAVWLGDDGFIGLTNGKVERLPEGRGRLMRQINRGRMVQATSVVSGGVYHCWLPHVAERVPGLCVTYDGAGWNRRTDTQARHAIVTDDYRQYVLIAGVDTNSGTEGVLVLDRESSILGAQSHTAVLETVWITQQSVDLKSLRRLILWGRETGLQSVTVEIMRDWREGVVTDTVTIPMNAPEDPPTTWDTGILGSETWERRRLFFGVQDLDLPSAQAFKLRFTASSTFDFIGFELQTMVSAAAGAWD